MYESLSDVASPSEIKSNTSLVIGPQKWLQPQMWLRLDFCNLYITFVYEMKTLSNFLGEILICKEKFGHHFSLKNF